jgi:PAS domain S-box-containing protein
MNTNRPNEQSVSPDPYFSISLGESAVVLLLLFGTYLTSHYNYLLFHSIAELFSILIAGTIAIVAINCWGAVRNQYVLFIGISYLFVGFLDILHTLAFKGMPIFKDYDYYAPQLWIAARYLESISMLIGLILLGSNKRVSLPWSMAGYSIVTAWLVASIFYFKVFPVCFVAGHGLTDFKVFSEYIICSIMLGNIALLYWRRQHFTPHVYRLLSGSAILMIGMELCFTLYFSDTMSDTFNLIGHLLKIGTFYLMYKAVIVTAFRDPMTLLFRELGEKEAELEDRVHERTHQLAESEKLFRAICDTSPLAIYMSSGIEQRAGYMNPTFTRLFGYTITEVPSVAEWWPLAYPDPGYRQWISEEWQRRAEKAIETRSAIEPMDVVVTARDGQKKNITWGFVSVGDQNWAFGLDLTARKEAEAELERHRDHLEAMVEERTAALTLAKEAAEAANRAKSTFLATMSHELRTPLNAIMGMTELAQRRAIDTKQIEQLTKVTKASRNLLAIITDVLDLSRIEAERLKFERTDFALDQVIENVSNLMHGLADEKHLELRIEVAPTAANLALQGDPQRLGQILTNLVANAVKFTDAGTVTVSVGLIEETESDVKLRFDIQDTGIGISAEDQARLFRAFEQIDGSFTRKYGGSGLGLAISKRLATMMNGDIGVVSELGSGSTFWFTVRLSKSGVAATPSETAPLKPRAQLKASHAGAHILVVEDDPCNQEITQGLLEEAGLVVDIASDGTFAVDMASRIRYDLILMDLQMSKMDGLEATRRIRQSSGNARVPVIALTANASHEAEARCREAGMNDFIGRPVESDVLFLTVMKRLDQPAAAA